MFFVWKSKIITINKQGWNSSLDMYDFWSWNMEKQYFEFLLKNYDGLSIIIHWTKKTSNGFTREAISLVPPLKLPLDGAVDILWAQNTLEKQNTYTYAYPLLSTVKILPC